MPSAAGSVRGDATLARGGYDVAIVGAGACGCEAALRLAALGRSVLLITTSLDTVFAAAGERVALDAPAGTLLHAIAADLDQADDHTAGAWEVHGAAKYRIEAHPDIHLLQSSVDGLVLRDGRVVGVETWEGVPRTARAVALCVGSFLRARLHIGDARERAGRPGEMAYDELADDLDRKGVRLVPERDAGGGVAEPAWTVHFERLADGAVDEHRIVGLPGAYAAGVCRSGPVDYPAAAADGRALAERIEGDLA